jgi:hypothetical protein
MAFLERKNEGRQIDKNTSLRRLEFMPRTSPKNASRILSLESRLGAQKDRPEGATVTGKQAH